MYLSIKHIFLYLLFLQFLLTSSFFRLFYKRQDQDVNLWYSLCSYEDATAPRLHSHFLIYWYIHIHVYIFTYINFTTTVNSYILQTLKFVNLLYKYVKECTNPFTFSVWLNLSSESKSGKSWNVVYFELYIFAENLTAKQFVYIK